MKEYYDNIIRYIINIQCKEQPQAASVTRSGTQHNIIPVNHIYGIL